MRSDGVVSVALWRGIGLVSLMVVACVAACERSGRKSSKHADSTGGRLQYYDDELKAALSRNSPTGSGPVVYMQHAAGSELVPYRDGMTLAEAIEKCGGFGAEAVIEMRILRRYQEADDCIQVPMYRDGWESFRLRKGDIVIPYNKERRLPDQTHYERKLQELLSRHSGSGSGPFVYVMGSVKNERVLTYEPEMTLGEAIARCGGFWHAFGMIIWRKDDRGHSLIRFRLQTDDWRFFPLRRDDIVDVGKESY